MVSVSWPAWSRSRSRTQPFGSGRATANRRTGSRLSNAEPVDGCRAISLSRPQQRRRKLRTVWRVLEMLGFESDRVEGAIWRTLGSLVVPADVPGRVNVDRRLSGEHFHDPAGFRVGDTRGDMELAVERQRPAMVATLLRDLKALAQRLRRAEIERSSSDGEETARRNPALARFGRAVRRDLQGLI